jgi:protein-disulfide isomerase
MNPRRLLAADETACASLVARRPKLTLAAMIAIALVFLQASDQADFARSTLPNTPVVKAILEDRESPSVGPANADVVVIVFTDYQCPVCRATDPALERLIAHDHRVRVVFKDWPIFGRRSQRAAEAVVATREQGKYLAMHRALMTTRLPLSEANLERIAMDAGVDWPRAESALQSGRSAIELLLRRQGLQAWSLGLQGTPDYIVGPYLIAGGLNDGALRRAVAAARKHAHQEG